MFFKHLNIKGLDTVSYGIQDTQQIQSSIEMEQFERLFFDNLNGDLTEEVQDYNYDDVNFSN